jgi:hypothetical protein
MAHHPSGNALGKLVHKAGKKIASVFSGSPKRLGPATLQRAVDDFYRKAYVASGGKQHEAWNQTLDHFAGPYRKNKSAAEDALQHQVTEALRRTEKKGFTGLRKKAGVGTLTYAVHPLDVWGNKRDGFEINDIYPSRGTIEIPTDARTADIVEALKKGGFIDRNIRHQSIGIEGEIGYTLNVRYEPTSHPEYELRPVSGSPRHRR